MLDPTHWEPSIHAALVQAVRAHGSSGPLYNPRQPPIAAFDFDNTCIRGDIGEAVLAAVGRAQGRDRLAEYVAVCEQSGRRVGYARCAEWCGNRRPADLEALTTQVLDQAIAAGHIAYRPAMVNLIDHLHRAGWQVWIVSASQHHSVVPAAERLGIARARVLGMQLGIDPITGQLVPPALEPLTLYEGKVQALRAATGRFPLLAAGDSDTDGPLLAAARYRLVVDRGDAQLLERARAGRWWIQPGWGSSALA